MSFSLSSTVRTHPTLPYKHIKDDIMGSDYSLSLVFIGEQRAQRLNKEHRKKTYTPNVLSFPLDASHGEIYITPTIAKKEAARRNMTYTTYVGFLFIHALLHLKGYQHSARMERAETRYLKRYDFVR